jgi:hypothetical protein
MTPMPQQFVTMKVTPASLQMIRLIAAKTGEKQYEVLSRLLKPEIRKLSLPVNQ